MEVGKLGRAKAVGLPAGLFDPTGGLADAVLGLCRTHPMYGTSALWQAWVRGLRDQDQFPAHEPAEPCGESLAGLRRRQRLTQKDVSRRIGISQSDVSELERRPDMRVSTLRAYVEATGGRLALVAVHDDQESEIRLGRGPG
ncbi:MAG: helix-turn-helix domain-containing protein [Acidimicrobiales bacterium]